MPLRLCLEEALALAFRSETALYASAALATFLVYKTVAKFHGKVSTTRLVGPPSTSLIYGVAKDTMESQDASSIYEEWVKKYGVAFEVPSALGQKKIMLFDSKALQHYYSRDAWTYIGRPATRLTLRRTVKSSKFVSPPVSYWKWYLDWGISVLVHRRGSS